MDIGRIAMHELWKEELFTHQFLYWRVKFHFYYTLAFYYIELSIYL